MLEQNGILFESGQHTESLILNADEVVKSPGIPDKAELIKKLHAAGIPVISEIEFAGRYNACEDHRHYRHQREDDHHHAHVSHAEEGRFQM